MSPLEIAAKRARDIEKAEGKGRAGKGSGATDDDDDDNDEAGDGSAMMSDAGIAEVIEDGEDPEDADAADDDGDVEAKAGDMFMCVARTEDEQSAMEVYTYDRTEGSLYVHHDFNLPAFPLAVEWMDLPPGKGAAAAAVATGAIAATDAMMRRASVGPSTASAPGSTAASSSSPSFGSSGRTSSAGSGAGAGAGGMDGMSGEQGELARKALQLASAVQDDDLPSLVGSYVAVGTFHPGIEIWNLDVLDPLEPSAILGGLAGQVCASGTVPGPAGKLAPGSHQDAVMGLSWSREHRRLLCSSSADKTVKLWDVTRGACINTWRHHTGKVVACRFHPGTGSAASIVATASYDRTVCVIDARKPKPKVMRSRLPADAEDVQWDPHNTWGLVACAEGGTVAGFDMRKPDRPAWAAVAHKDACHAVSFAPLLPGVLATAGADKKVKVWDTTRIEAPGGSASSGAPGRPLQIGEKEMGAGQLFTCSFLPHAPMILACGGSKGELALWDIEEDDSVLFTKATAPVGPGAPKEGAKGRMADSSGIPSLKVRTRPDGQLLAAGAKASGASAGAGAARMS